jgi:hypothetical protein
MDDIQKDLVWSLISASAGYGKAGLASMVYGNPQVVIGNLAIAIELLLKAFIAKRSLLLLFKGLPLELRCALSSPQSMPKSFRRMPYKIGLMTSSYKSIELEEAISMFGVFCPEIKKRLNAHLRFLSRHRNTSVHAVLPDCQEYEVQRTVFLFLMLVDHISKTDPELVKYVFINEKKQREEFLARFDEERLNRVHTKVEKATEKAKGITEKWSIAKDAWDLYPIECPVCGSDGILIGETTPDSDEDGTSLFFVGETFECEQCGLTLEDYDEMNIAGVDPEVDRSDEVERWEEENYDYEPW